jgi:two-component system nitrogen regulation sensor histidine kinase NtrY
MSAADVLASTPDRRASAGRVSFLPGRARYLYAAVYAVCAVLTGVTIFLTAAAPAAKSVGPASSLLLSILAVDFAGALGLVAVGLWRVLRLFGPSTRDAGLRLHRRFVGLFALAAVAPAVIVALFFGLLVTRGVESWFSSRVRNAVDNSATIARAYVNEQRAFVAKRVAPIVSDLTRAQGYFVQSRMAFSRLLLEDMATYDFAAIYVIDGEGRVLARAEQPEAPPYAAPAPETIAGAQKEVQLAFDSLDMARAVFRLPGFPDAYVYLVRPLGEGVMGQLRSSEASVVAYREAERARGRIQLVFALSYAVTAILVLVGAVWLGIAAASSIAAPVARLVQAADRVAAGDLAARVLTGDEPPEIAVLSRAFDRMTADLAAQQAALRLAGEDAESRRRFIERVLADVSAGVVGLDGAGAISVVNSRAAALLGLGAAAVDGLSLAEAAPELAPVADRAQRSGVDAEAEIDVKRDGETRRLRVRASARSEAGQVLTFDDITRLLAAQRNAAWRDVARRIAHEIKNPLTPIQLSAERLRRKYRREITADLETFDRCTETIIRQVGDIGRMVDEFSAFARMPAPTFAREDAAELLREAVFAQRVAYPEVAVDMDDLAAAHVEADGRMLGQALANVLKNAGEAVAARMAAEPGLRGAITVRLDAEGPDVGFVIEDNGVGLPVKDRERLTEPYVTTREKGTGLGLAIVRRILEEHGGELLLGDAQTLPGARVVLRLPKRGPDGARQAGAQDDVALQAAE